MTFPLGQELEFNFVVKSQSGKIAWEVGDNRTFTASGGESCVEWGTFRRT